ncbi:MAG TPA: helix-turn-helix domain-containing protein, partial [Promineifilum sp.]|nr:helix-turn-helix domain-containing protein [Promineifilum sp.]
MDTNQKCQEVLDERGWTQRELASALGISETSLSNARHGRRPLPAYAIIKLEKLRGTDAETILQQLIKTAACIALVVVSFTLTPAPANAATTPGKATPTVCIMSTWVRVRAWLLKAAG